MDMISEGAQVTADPKTGFITFQLPMYGGIAYEMVLTPGKAAKIAYALFMAAEKLGFDMEKPHDET